MLSYKNKNKLIKYIFLIFSLFVLILFLFPLNAAAETNSGAMPLPAGEQQAYLDLSTPSEYTGRTMGEIIKISLIAALIITVIVVGIMFGLHRASLKSAPCATSYKGQKGFREKGRSDIFIGSRTTRVKIEQNNTGPGSPGGISSGGAGKGGTRISK